MTTDLPDPRNRRDRGRLSFLRDKRGIAAVEFALVVPLMIAMYLGTIEMSAGVSVNKKVSRVAATVADLVTQQETTNKADLLDIMEIGESVLFPYTLDKPDIVVVGINVHTSHPQGGKVAWSRRYDKGTYKIGLSTGSDVFVPDDLRIDDTFLVRVDTGLDYIPIVRWLIGDGVGTIKNGVGVIEMEETYFYRPRLGGAVDCTDC